MEGDAGAPLEQEEVHLLRDIYSRVRPFLTKKGRDAIELQGTSIKTDKGVLETPLIGGAECAYTVFDHKGTAKCGIEEAYLQGEIDYRKPISCHFFCGFCCP